MMLIGRMLVLLVVGASLFSSAARAAEDGEGAAQVEDATSVSDEEFDAETAEFNRELRTVEEDVGSLKERVFRSKATLQLLKELVIDSGSVGSQVVLWHVNNLSGAYSMESVQYFLDEKNVYTMDAPDGSLDESREFKAHEQTIPPGNHTLQVNMVLRGKGYQLFSYLRSYQFKVQSSYSFVVEEGKVNLVRVVAESRGGFKNFVERPSVRYDLRTETIREE